MPEFCDVALAVPLDMMFTYRVPVETAPVVGGRVLVPFRQQRFQCSQQIEIEFVVAHKVRNCTPQGGGLRIPHG